LNTDSLDAEKGVKAEMTQFTVEVVHMQAVLIAHNCCCTFCECFVYFFL